MIGAMATVPAEAAPPTSVLLGSEWRRMGRRGLASAVFGVAIAAAFWATTDGTFGRNLAFSLCISVCCWALIDGGRFAVARGLGVDAWPGWRWMLPIVAFGAVVGYVVGSVAANVLLGQSAAGPFEAGSLRGLSVVLVFGLVPALGATYLFYSREALATREALMQRAERQAAEQRLKLIESQLDPHMLFNTLANLRALIAVDPTRAQAMLDRLIAFLRASLAGSRASRHPLADEFARLGDYLALMQIRMGSRLAFRFDLPVEFATAPVPSFLLQPLVENAIVHGLEPKVGGGTIDVVARRDGDALLLEVLDSGIGLPAVPDSGSARQGGGFGLGHVRERLGTLHGDRASIAVGPRPDGRAGTSVVLRLPLETA